MKDNLLIIYKITNLINGKLYIGQTIRGLKARWRDHLKPSQNTQIIDRAIKKYGKHNFRIEVIDSADTLENLNLKEAHWIKTLETQNKDFGYNIASGGENFEPSFETTLKRLLTRKKTMIKKNGATGILHDRENGKWGYKIGLLGKNYKTKNLETKYEAQIARDIKLLEFFPADLILDLLNFPENIDFYLNKTIKPPVAKRKISQKRSKYLCVVRGKKENNWYAAISKNGKREFVSAYFEFEIDAAKVADYYNLKYNGADCKLINFPENVSLYLSDGYILPKTLSQKNKSVENKYISYLKEKRRFLVNLSWKFDITKCFKTLPEAKTFRDKILTEHGLPIPD